MPPGTNGAVSLLGLVASALGGVTIGVTWTLTSLLTMHVFEWEPVLIGLWGGASGSLVYHLESYVFLLTVWVRLTHCWGPQCSTLDTHRPFRKLSTVPQSTQDPLVDITYSPTTRSICCPLRSIRSLSWHSSIIQTEINAHHIEITDRMDFPSCISWNASLILSKGKSKVTSSSILILPSRYC